MVLSRYKNSTSKCGVRPATGVDMALGTNGYMVKNPELISSQLPRIRVDSILLDVGRNEELIFAASQHPLLGAQGRIEG